MAVAFTETSSTDPSPGDTALGGAIDAPDLRAFVFALFFIFGGITSLNDILAPKLKELFTLNDLQMNLVNLAFFISYAVVSIPAAALVRRIGYMRGAAAGLVIMAASCCLFIPAARTAEFGLFLLAIFGLGAGITLVQVVANPLISLLGPRATTGSRLTFAQAFNSLGTVIFPRVGGPIIFGALGAVSAATLSGAALVAYRSAESQIIVKTYLALAAALLVVAGVVWSRRHRLPARPAAGTSILGAFDLLTRLRFGWGAACIFLYVGAEVAIGTILVNYLGEAGVWAVDAATASKYVALYWGGAMVGRFVGSWLLRQLPPGLVLAGAAVGAVLLAALSANIGGVASGWALLAVGCMNSIMFPTIFTLASEGVEERREEASGLLCMAIVGGAIVPLAYGHLADLATRQFALVVPALCYGVIAAYGVYARRPAV